MGRGVSVSAARPRGGRRHGRQMAARHAGDAGTARGPRADGRHARSARLATGPAIRRTPGGRAADRGFGPGRAARRQRSPPRRPKSRRPSRHLPPTRRRRLSRPRCQPVAGRELGTDPGRELAGLAGRRDAGARRRLPGQAVDRLWVVDPGGAGRVGVLLGIALSAAAEWVRRRETPRARRDRQAPPPMFRRRWPPPARPRSLPRSMPRTSFTACCREALPSCCSR